jgi:hypothetical protein
MILDTKSVFILFFWTKCIIFLLMFSYTCHMPLWPFYAYFAVMKNLAFMFYEMLNTSHTSCECVAIMLQCQNFVLCSNNL